MLTPSDYITYQCVESIAFSKWEITYRILPSFYHNSKVKLIVLVEQFTLFFVQKVNVITIIIIM